MKSTFFLTVMILLALCVTRSEAQTISGSSSSKRITAGKAPVVSKTVKAIPDLIIKNEEFLDPNSNNIINGNERSSIRFQIENLGSGTARKVHVKVGLKGSEIKGLSYLRTSQIGDIKGGETKDVIIPLHGSLDLDYGSAEFLIEVREELGFDAYPLEMKIISRPFEPPKVLITDAVFSTLTGGRVQLNAGIQLKVLMQNIGKGDAQDVKIRFYLPNAYCMFLGDTGVISVGILKSGETKEFDFDFLATRRYAEQTIPVQIFLSEAMDLYTRDTVVAVRLNQNLVAKNQVEFKPVIVPQGDIQIASLSSDIDKNIPYTRDKNQNRYALIIGNEEYSEHQTDMNTEVNVDFARNDAKIFRKYVINTLGFPEENVYLLEDATAGAMGQKIDMITKLATKIGSDAEVIFYYAGHGLPDESTRVPYLIPVDVTAGNLSRAVKLSSVYNKFSETGARRIIIVLDACFSGGGRESGLLAARSVKIKPVEEFPSGNMIVFSATTGEQSALPYRKEKHGMFTYFLLKKLQESGGDLTYGDLANYVRRNVAVESLKINQKEQDPTVSISADIKDVWESWKLR
ncbi:MAG: caspase family protein [Bacteroidia bacterium]|nr:caspase family protein [Bacteroidia bacterium]